MSTHSDDPGILSDQANELLGEDFNAVQKLLIKALKLNSLDPKAHKGAAFFYLYQRNYEHAIKHAKECIANLPQFERIYFNVLLIKNDARFCLAESYFFTGKYSTAEKIYAELVKLNDGVSEVFSPSYIEKKLQIIKEIQAKSIVIESTLSEEQRTELAKELEARNSEEREEFLKKMKECEQYGYMDKLGLPVAIIPNRWFEVWKQYVGIGSRGVEMKGTKQQQQEEKVEEGEVEEIEFFAQHPGWIDASDIVETWPKWSKNVVGFRAEEKQPMILKKNMQENSDFIILPLPAANVLYRRYGGDQVKRSIVSVDDDSEASGVEVHLMKIRFACLSSTVTLRDSFAAQDKVYWMFVSKYETIASVKQAIWMQAVEKDLYEERQNRLWKGEPGELNVTNLAKQYQEADHSKVFINAFLLDKPSTILDEAEIAENDLIIFEISKATNNWVLQNQETQELEVDVCGFCGKSSDDLYYCECELIQYCNLECLKSNLAKHRIICKESKEQQRYKKEILSKYSINSSSKSPDKKSQKKQRVSNGICGLQNLGNTCFMNSSLQCLSNVAELTEFMIKDQFVRDLNHDNPLGSGGYLAAAYAGLIKDMWEGSSSSVSPWNFKKTIGKFAPQFSGYSQHDSSELLSYLVDGIHEDLNRVRRKPQVEQIESNGKNDIVDAQNSWKNYLKRNQSIIVDLMVGQFKSTLNCPGCKRVSVTFDPFMTISVPMPSIAMTQVAVYVASRSMKELTLLQCSMRVNSTVRDLKERVAREFSMQPSNLAICKNSNDDNSEMFTFPEEVEIAKLIENKSESIFAFEMLSRRIDQDYPINTPSK